MFAKWQKWVVGFAGLWMGCAIAPAAAPAHWVGVRSTHFIVLSDAGEKDAVRLAGQFERMRQVFGAMLPAGEDSSAQPVRVIAVKDRREMQALEPAAYEAAGQIDLAGFFMHCVDKDYILVRMDAEQAHAYSVVYHEYTHSMLREASGWMPLWLNEGLAQFYENTEFEDNAVWLGESNPEQLNLLRRSELLPLTTLLTVDAGSPNYHDEARGSIFYAESWALTHLLTMGDRLQGTHRLRDYTERLALGEESATAAAGAFGDLNKLQAQLADYVLQRKFMYFMMPEERTPDEEGIASRAMTDAEADAVRADVMAHTGRATEARALLDRGSAADATNGLAHEAMGYLQYRAGDFTSAKEWLIEAVKIDPASFWAHTYLASAMTRMGDQGADAAIESHLREALRLNPEFAPAYDALAMFGIRRHGDLVEAETFARRAVELEPGELSFRLDCAEVMTGHREFAEALSMLRQAMPLAKTAEDIAAVHDRMARVERSQTASAGVSGSARRTRAAAGYGQ